VYDEKGKELKAKESTGSQANGETNGTPAADATTKAMDEAAKEPKKTFNCYSCGVDCTRSRFHYAKTESASNNAKPEEIKYDLCPNCYFQSRMPSSHRSSDFVKMEDPSHTNIPDKDAEWTDSEVLLLLEGLENFDNNWAEISNHVGTRTREECVMKFLQLDIQDQFMEDGAVNGSSTLRALGGRDPISQTENPVMSVVSFLAQLADPKLVAAATQRSTEHLHMELRTNLEKGIGGTSSEEMDNNKTSSEAGEAVKPETSDSMEIDTSISAQPPAAATTSTNGTTSSIEKIDLPSLALSSAAARSATLSTLEERELTRLVGAAVNLSISKLQLKLQQFSELEDIVQAERRDLEKGRQQLFLDRLAFKKRVREMETAFRAASLKSPEEGMRLMAEVVGGNRGASYAFTSGEGDVQAGSGGIQAPSDENGDGFRRVEI
jgi:SWI/SNF related-matrix-associated actin-dependent regulator of chromatin subfamily C